MKNKDKRLKHPHLHLFSSSALLHFQLLQAAHIPSSVLLTTLQSFPFLKYFLTMCHLVFWAQPCLEVSPLSAGSICVRNGDSPCRGSPSAPPLPMPEHLHLPHCYLCSVSESYLGSPGYQTAMASQQQRGGECTDVCWGTSMQQIFTKFNSLSLEVQINVLIWCHSGKLPKLIHPKY